MTRFSGSIWLPSDTLTLLAEAAKEHDCTVQRHAELCITAACRIMGGIYRDIERIASRAQRLGGEFYLSLDGHALQVLGARSIDAGVSVEAFARAVLIHAVEGLETGDLPFLPGPKKEPAAFRTYKPARVIVERDTRLGTPTYNMGDPPPGRSALDRKRAMEAVR